ncbi:centrosomal AT-AC splicing factor-like [Montipora capricornis]|uniref:centrosomal AT-AC splicing factor-like n=1 Tax=Montipora capricornis TaxID=246305 RepID=UPI0035F11E2D
MYKMADDTDEFEVKGQFLFCRLCRLNHDKGRKHIYSRKHKELLSKLLTKFGRKVDEARKFLKRPTVEDGELEPGSRFWCHFCHENANKHVTDRDVTIKFGGVFEHFASESHRKNLHTFWWENGADKSLKGKFLVDQKTFSSYKEEVDKKLKEFECQQELNRQKIVSQIKEKEVIQAHASQQPPDVQVEPEIIYKTVQSEQGILQNPTGWHEGQRVWGGGIVKYRPGSTQWFPWMMDLMDNGSKSCPSSADNVVPRFQTAQAYGENLTCIGIVDLKQGEGNIHTGAMPPWLQDDDDDNEDHGNCAIEKNDVIGPSHEAFKKHVERMKRVSNKNPRRVGANFDRKKETSDDWLPSFGRVWNQGPRWQSRHEFRGESSRKKAKKK